MVTDYASEETTIDLFLNDNITDDQIESVLAETHLLKAIPFLVRQKLLHHPDNNVII